MTTPSKHTVIHSLMDDPLTIPPPPRPALIPSAMRQPPDYGWRRDRGRGWELPLLMVFLTCLIFAMGFMAGIWTAMVYR